MQQVDGDLVVSATDLTRFLACRHLTRLDLEVARGLRPAPPEHDESTEVLFRRGRQHEEAYLDALRRSGATIVEITVDPALPTAAGLRGAEADTVAAMAAGVDVVYQATFFAAGWRGHADLLLRRPDRPGRWAWSYDVADTKLARRLSAGALLQMSVYAERLTELQGVPPEQLVVVTGDGVRRPVPFDHCARYARGVRAALQAFLADPPATDPQPVRHCARCRWRPDCRARWLAEDRLNLVAQLRTRHAAELRAAGITTLTALAAADPAALPEGLPPDVARRAVAQAGLQLAERSGAGPQHRLLPPEPGRGLASLPQPSPGDVFFDIEGDPHVGEVGLEYLFGVVSRGRYTAFWATDPAQERAAFEALVDFLTAAWRDDPDMHVYHYAAYEPARLTALAGRYDTRVAEVERLLRGQRLVDLYTVVKQGVQVGKESYSLKRLEDHYWGHGRDAAGVGDAMASVVAFERWLIGDSTGDDLLESIRAYNEEDCRSTEALRDWLEGLRREGGGDPTFPRPAPSDVAPVAPSRARERAARAAALRATLIEGGRSDRVLAALVDWHRREALPDAMDRGPADGVPGPTPAEEALAELAAWVAEHGVEASLPAWRVARDVLLRRTAAGGRPPGESAVIRFAAGASGEGFGVLPVHGPPGTGRRAVAARAVLAAVAAGRRVGVCGATGASADALVREVAVAARRAGRPLRAVQQVESGRPPGDPDVARTTGARQARAALRAGRVDVVVGPPALFAHPALRGGVDLLVVDDAPLADVLAAAGAAGQLLLLGDRRGLGRRVRGTHPPGAAVSALEYLTGDGATPGVRLEEADLTHPAIARLVGDLSGDGPLRAAAGCERLRVDAAGALHGSGLRWVAAAAGGSEPVVGDLVRGLLTDGRWTDRDGTVRPLRPRDVLVLVLYERQVRGLRRAIAAAAPAGVDVAGVRVGTMDALRDDEAPVVLHDVAGAGTPDGGPAPAPVVHRERLAEVLSRAGALAVVVADPALLVAPAADPRQLDGLDALCRIEAEAEHVRPRAPAAVAW